jgi:PAS domain S-box-containing protein
MELNLLISVAALPAALLAASAALAHAYNRLHARHQRSERDRASYLEVLEGSNDALFVINFVNGRIYQANAQASRLLGYERDRLERLSVFDLVPPELLQCSAMRIADAWERHGLVFDDIPLIAADGERLPVECSTRVTTYAGKPAIILFARDIRERMALQRWVAEQQAVVKQQNEDLLSSIRYAQRIQRAVLPEAASFQDLFPESFILYRPRDIVSGDLFWFAERDGVRIVAAADCTGHGVPGALLSLIGASLLEETVNVRGLLEPAAILEALREGFDQALNRNAGDEGHRDGMNIGLASIDAEGRQLRFAGAYHPLLLLRGTELHELKGDRMPIGRHEGEHRPFTESRVDLQPGDRLFLFSDGLVDQFGGPQGKKLRASGLKEWLLATAGRTIEEQHQGLSDRFREWKGKEEQVDDVLLIGLQV